MAFSISRALNIEKKEQGVVYLLLVQSVFLGIFAGALDVGANALFLDAYSADQMPRAFMISGAVGIAFTSMYTFFQKRLPFKLFTIVNLIIVVLFTGALRFGYSFTDDPRVSFALLVLMGPLIIISMLGFWGTAGRYFTLREGKRLFGIIDTGSVVGMILAFYAVPVLVRFNFNVYDTLLIGFGSLLLALLFQIIVLQKHELIASPVTGRKNKRKTGIFSIFRKRYTSMMALFVILSVVTAFFIHYAFMWSTEANYTDNRELTGFLGAFFGTMMIFTVIIKSTLYGWLMKNYGLRVTLLISPVLLLILTVVAAVVGGFFGYTAEAASFTLFFLVIALSKLFNKSLKDAIESPSMKILYQSLDSEERFDVQAMIDGVVNEFTAFGAGLLMAGLLLLSFIGVIHFSYILVFILIIWVILGFSLYKSYRKTLNDSLASVRQASIPGEDKEEEALVDPASAPLFNELIRLDPYFYYYQPGTVSMEAILDGQDLRMQKSAWRFIAGTLYQCDRDFMNKVLKGCRDEELKSLVLSYAERLDVPGGDPDADFRSNSKPRILAALTRTVETGDVDQVPYIITLLRERDLELRSAAIEAAGKLKVKELGSYLVDYLGHPDLYPVTWSSLVNMGEIILENLENTFHKTGVEVIVQLRIVRAMVAIGGSRSNDYLFHKINYHQREVREAAILGLYKNGYTPAEQSIPTLQSAIYDAVLAGAANVAAEYVVHENDPGNSLLEAITEEKQRTDKLIFTLLGITYDRSAVGHVQESIEDIENEDTGFALELLNLIVDDQVFAYLEPYFDDISVVEKIRRLQNEMPVEILAYDALLNELLVRDSLYAGKYLRVCAIDAIRLSDTVHAGQYLAAQAFHPDPEIRRSASQVLAEKDKALYEQVVERMEMEETSYSGIIGTVEEIKGWESFQHLDRELVFQLASEFIENGQDPLHDTANVSLIRDESAGVQLFSGGLVLNLADYPELSAQMAYLAERPAFKLFQLNRKTFREMLFDEPALLHTCRELFKSSDAIDLMNLKVK